MPILDEILEWVNENTRPNNRYKYSRCVICRNAWWDDHEQHSYDCWVPRLKNKVHEQALSSQDSLISLQAENVGVTPAN
jgi:hypothetical protein